MQAYAEASADYSVAAPPEVAGDKTYTKSRSSLEDTAWEESGKVERWERRATSTKAGHHRKAAPTTNKRARGVKEGR